MKKFFIFISCALVAGLSVFSAVPKIIFDTDMYTDFDDVGALAVLHTLADAGECELIGTVASTRGSQAVGMIEIINAFYGRANLPVAEPKGIGVGPENDPGAVKNKSYRIYADMVKASSAVRHHSGVEPVPDANEVYRKLLAAAPDKSVTIVSVGFTTNLRRLLETKGDAVSPLDGRALVAKKVNTWYAMACRFPNGFEYNSMMDGESTKIAFAQWPTPIYVLDCVYGRDVYCGVPAARLADEANPVRNAFKRALHDYGESNRGHAAWDEITALAAVRGWEAYFGVERGRFDITMKKGRGYNTWTKDEKGNHCVLTVKTPKAEVGKIVDELIARGPRAKGK